MRVIQMIIALWLAVISFVLLAAVNVFSIIILATGAIGVEIKDTAVYVYTTIKDGLKKKGEN